MKCEVLVVVLMTDNSHLKFGDVLTSGDLVTKKWPL